MKKLIAMLLVLIMVLSLVPMSASARSWKDYTDVELGKDGKWYGVKDGKTPVALTDAEVEAYLAYVAYEDHPHPDDTDAHTFNGYGFNTKYHWLECACGCKISMERHVDPLDTTDDTCTCGYHFSDNAELVVLWLEGAFPITDFNKDVHEYTINAHTYMDFKEVKISTFTYDSEATVEYPEDLTLKEGENVFEIKVTAENKKVTEVYTVTVVK